MNEGQLREEVYTAAVDCGFDSSEVIHAMSMVYVPGLTFSRWFRLTVAWVEENWLVLAPLYMAVCVNSLIERGYIITSFDFTRSPDRVGYITVVSKDSLQYGSDVYAVKRTVHGLSYGAGLVSSELLERL